MYLLKNSSFRNCYITVIFVMFVELKFNKVLELKNIELTPAFELKSEINTALA